MWSIKQTPGNTISQQTRSQTPRLPLTAPPPLQGLSPGSDSRLRLCLAAPCQTLQMMEISRLAATHMSCPDKLRSSSIPHNICKYFKMQKSIFIELNESICWASCLGFLGECDGVTRRDLFSDLPWSELASNFIITRWCNYF